MNTITDGRKTPDRSQTGSSLIVAMAIVTLAAAGAGGLFLYAGSQATMGRRSDDYLRARAIAESGLNVTYNMLRSNFRANYSPGVLAATNFGGGTYQVSFRDGGNNTNLATLVATGTFHGAMATVAINLRYYPEVVTTTYGSYSTIYGPYTFTNTLLVGGNVDWTGGGSFADGSRAHANGYISLGGSADWAKSATGTLYVSSSTKFSLDSGSATLEATWVKAPVITSYKAGNLTATKYVQSVAQIPIPTIELSPFYTMALKGGQVKTNYNLQPSGSYTVPGGFMWVVGDLDIKGAVCGCFVATGNITLESGAVVTPYAPGFPTLLARDGQIKMTGQADITGVVIAQNSGVNWNGGGNVRNGALVCSGALSKGGSSGSVGFSLPGNSITIYTPDTSVKTNSTSRLVIQAWQ